jgi:aspartate 1-decarboxylase
MNGYRKLLGSKIHRATVTDADLDYEGSISIPLHLLKAADIMPYEAVQIWDVTSGNRLETYAIEGENNSRNISINGAAAHLIKRGDVIIIARFIYCLESDCLGYKPKVIFLDEFNRIKEVREEIPGPALPASVSRGSPQLGS